MMRCLIFDTQPLAQTANDAITQRGRELFVASGWTVDAGGNVVPKRASDNLDAPGAQRTSTWAVPEQRITDGKWWIPHPENAPEANLLIAAVGMTVVQYSMQDIASPVIDIFDVSWRA